MRKLAITFHERAGFESSGGSNQSEFIREVQRVTLDLVNDITLSDCINLYFDEARFNRLHWVDIFRARVFGANEIEVMMDFTEGGLENSAGMNF